MDTKIVYYCLLCCCCTVGHADPVDDFRNLQNEIESGIDRITEIEKGNAMLQIAFSPAAKEAVGDLLPILFPEGNGDETKKKAVFHILFLKAFPDDSLTAMRAIGELLDLHGVTRGNAKNMLQSLKDSLHLSDESPIGRWIKNN
ncbi:MAG: hypothetical protein LBB05_00640 [Puniceicoccales bacterium]|jgi:hypothetical protein|nr:hypothetical protein [Puniceicoccales bacterium]